MLRSRAFWIAASAALAALAFLGVRAWSSSAFPDDFQETIEPLGDR